MSTRALLEPDAIAARSDPASTVAALKGGYNPLWLSGSSPRVADAGQWSDRPPTDRSRE